MRVDLFPADGEKDKQTDGQRDMTMLIVAFRNFANAPKTIQGLDDTREEEF